MIVKTCKKHGELTIDQVHLKGKSNSGKQYYGCNQCKSENAKRFYKHHIDEIKVKSAEYHQERKLKPDFKQKKKKWMHDYDARKRLLYPDKVREKDRKDKKRWSDKHRDKINKEFKEMRDNLHPMYVRAYLKNHYGFDDPSDKLVHAKATIMLLKREIMKVNVGMGKKKYVSKTGRYKRGHASKDSESRIISGSTKDFIKSKDI